MFQYTLIAVRQAMVCLINDDGPEIVRRELSKTFLPHKRLYGSDCDAEPAAKACLFCLLRGASKACRLINLVGCLVKKFPTVSQDQHPVTAADTFFCYFGKNDRFPAPCRKNQQGALYAFFPFSKDTFPCLFLICP